MSCDRRFMVPSLGMVVNVCWRAIRRARRASQRICTEATTVSSTRHAHAYATPTGLWRSRSRATQYTTAASRSLPSRRRTSAGYKSRSARESERDGCMHSGLQQLLLPRHFDEAWEPSRLGGARAPSSRCDAEISRTAAARRGGGRRVDLHDHLLGHKALEVAIKHAWHQHHMSASAFQDLVHHSERVQIAIGKREQDLEPVRWQRRRLGTGSKHQSSEVYTCRYIPRHSDGRTAEKVAIA